ncbi:endonuclease [bacterium CG_4_10_14_0_2_um_filter_33_32]|nr:MAG: endonuclease [bacterium CG10_big_fil_rev_8_21_14_0_10_33_18]PIU76784.1 MAG: endonuclease [bacterium CG06_land_8_20_14_3_00_33_50]PIW81584.1 MAG: endonuclease [bacterium CG_4_8_14_3_um_filter_33_28]PIY84800.1 MAG: endonuclease [bacterium CG_4_10_14_0_8_um_filter_33_57]PIZ85694.1 MAG: endonuclease [bacterium CG_4_10_14_0_2_um_filter_33_32]
MYYVYIIYSSKLDKTYKGSTDNLRERIDSHNNRKVKSTKLGIPWKLIYYEAFISKVDAKREELFLKSGKGRERLQYLLQNTLKKR